MSSGINIEQAKAYTKIMSYIEDILKQIRGE